MEEGLSFDCPSGLCTINGGLLMWCRACQQDVPGVVSSSQNPTVSCVRCGKPLAGAGTGRNRLVVPHITSRSARTADAIRPPESAPVLSSSVEDFPEFVEQDDWEFEETIRQAQQLLSSVTDESPTGLSQRTSERTNSSRRPSVERPAVVEPETTASAMPAQAKPSGTWPWVMLAFGLGVFACGAALMGLSLAKGSTPLWQLGLPMVLGGQLAVLFVVIWQLDVVWLSNRATFVALHSVDEQLRQLQVRASHHVANSQDVKTFSRHLAEDVSPHMLLKDLREPNRRAFDAAGETPRRCVTTLINQSFGRP